MQAEARGDVGVLTVQAPTSRPLLTLGLTFLLLGIGFASPFRLAPQAPAHIWEGAISRETLNLYALTVFAGWGHFFYAWRGQWKGSGRLQVRHRVGFWLSVAVLLGALIVARSVLGFAVFSLLVWVWNIEHFAKAERFFAGQRAEPRTATIAVAAFAWFTLCLFQAGPLKDIRIVFAGTLVLAAGALALGSWKKLASGGSQLPLLTLFLLGETLVWSAYGPYMTEAFRVGVYIFHVAGASFFHYLAGYFYAESRNADGRDRLLTAAGVAGINCAVIVAGVAIVWIPWLAWLRPVFGLEAFTLFVALHLGASDIFPWWKRRATSR